MTTNFLFIIMLLLTAAFPAEKKMRNIPVTECTTSTDVLVSTDNAGLTWQSVHIDLPDQAQAMSIWSGDNSLYLGASDGLYRGAISTITPMWRKDPISQISISGIHPGKSGPYLVSNWHSFYQYREETGTLVKLHEALKDRSVFGLLEASDGRLFAACGSGLYVTADRGKTWETSLKRNFITSVVESNGALLATTESGLMRSADKGETWERVLTDPGRVFYVNRINEGLIAIVEGQRFAGINTPNEIYLSTDDGATWNPFNDKLPDAFSGVYSLQEVGNYLYACNREGIFRSTDRGMSWELVRKANAGESNFFRLTATGDTLFALSVTGC